MYMCTYTHISDDITSTFQIQFLCLTPQNSNHPIMLRRLGFFRNTFQQLFNNNVALQQENIRCFSLCWFWNLSSLKPLLESIYWSSTGPVPYTKRHFTQEQCFTFLYVWWMANILKVKTRLHKPLFCEKTLFPVFSFLYGSI